MKLRQCAPLVASLLCALAGAAGCLNPRPEDFPSTTDLEGEGDTASVGGGSNAGNPGAQTDRPDDGNETPDPNGLEDPGDMEPPYAPDPEPDFGADAGVPPDADAGTDGGCTSDAD
jgi:hypothetical protein